MIPKQSDTANKTATTTVEISIAIDLPGELDIIGRVYWG